MLGLDTSYLTNAGVDPESVRAVVGIAGPYDFLPLKGQRSRRLRLGCRPRRP